MSELIDFELADFDFADIPTPAEWGALRDYQQKGLAAVKKGWADGFTRLLVVKATGTGKTVLFSAITRDEVDQGGRVLILCHQDELIEQARDKLSRSTGIEADKEKASDRASLDAKVVVASIQTLMRPDRLTGWPDDHFTLVIGDEAHLSLAPSWQRVLRYFHFGAESLNDDWVFPEPGQERPHLARVLGVTATADRGDKRTLGEFYEHIAFEYGLLEACRDGYLVRPVCRQIPLQIDLRGIKTARTAAGSDYDLHEITLRISPFLHQIAVHIAKEALDRKTVMFLPSIDTARLLADALVGAGINANFVSGACPDRAEKIEWFAQAGPGSAICNAMLLTTGWDCPDVSCVCVLRPTKIRSLYVQCVGRGTRTLPGVIDGLETPEERLAAIAASAKPDLRILDFLWLSDRLDLIKPIDVVATRPEIRDRMAGAEEKEREKGGDLDLINLEMGAERDLLAHLQEAAQEHSKKSARTIDPLQWAVSLGDSALAGYVPESRFDELPATPGQLKLLAENKVDVSKVTCRGLASKMIERINYREKAGLCSPKQLFFLEKNMGIMDAALYTKDRATRVILRRIRGR